MTESLREFNLDLIRQYCRKDYNEEFEDSMMKTLFERKDYAMVVECLKNGFEMTQSIFQEMIESYDLRCYQYLFTNKWKMTSKILRQVVESENLELIQWCCSSTHPKIKIEALIISIEIDRLDIFQCLISFQRYDTDTFYMEAVRNSSISILDWLIVNYPPINKERIEECLFGYIIDNKTFKWLRNHGFRV